MPKRKRADHERRTSSRIVKQAPAKAEKVDTTHSVLGGMRDPTLNSRVSGDKERADAQMFKVPFNDKSIVCERRGGDGGSSNDILVFTHGAGGGLDNPATRDFAIGYATEAPVVSYQGTMNLKSRIKTFHAMIAHESERGVAALGGRSMGARAAVVAATESETEIDSLVLVSYPLIGGQKGDRRDQILYDLPARKNVLFVSGSQDSMCHIDELQQVMEKMDAATWLAVVEGADHSMSLKPKAAVQPMRFRTGALAAQWVRDRESMGRKATLNWDEEEEVIVLEQSEIPMVKEAASTGKRPVAKKPRRKK